ncbi:MAG: ATP-binding protein [Aquabacterium sp.]
MNATSRRFSAWPLHIHVLAPALLVVLLVGGLGIMSVRTLAGMRGYVGGESLWSKARSEAIQHLRDYARQRDARHFAAFEQALAIPLADRRAREEMARPHPDHGIISASLQQGGIHADDVDNMATLFIWFGDNALLADSLRMWQQADDQISRLREQAERLRGLVNAKGNAQAIDDKLQEIERINDTLRSLELSFNASIGHAARISETVMVIGMAVSTVLLSMAAYLMIRRPLARQTRQQAALLQANRRWELAVAGSGLGLWEADPATGRIHLDARAAELCGLPAEARTFERQELYQLLKLADGEATQPADEQAARSGQMFKTQRRIVLPDGHVRHLEAIGRLGIDPATGTPRVIGISRDVTQEVAQAETAVARDAAERIADSQRAFLSRLSHELRTPLNAVLGFAQLLSIDKTHPLSAAQQNQVKWILDAGAQLLHLVEDVLDLSKVEMGEIHMQIQPCDTADLLQAALPLVEAARARFEVQIIDHLPTPAPMVMADPKRLLQVYVNLLTNGCKYNRPGGQLTVNARLEGTQVLLDFGDNGVGLSAEEAASLFQPFRRVPMASANVEGTGLGLYIVRQLVERMQGSVSVRSEPGVGSCFTVALPMAAVQ